MSGNIIGGAIPLNSAIIANNITPPNNIIIDNNILIVFFSVLFKINHSPVSI